MAAEKNRSSKLATVESNLSRKQVNLVESNHHPSAELLATIKSLTDKVASITKLETSVSCLQKELELMRNPKDESRCFEMGSRTDPSTFRGNGASGQSNSQSYYRRNDEKKRDFENIGDGKFEDGKNSRIPGKGRDGRYTASCKACAEEGLDRCSHCKKCGGSNHYARHCLQSPKGMGLQRKGGHQ